MQQWVICMCVCMCVAGPENVDLEDPEMQGVMPRAISQVTLSGNCQADN